MLSRIRRLTRRRRFLTGLVLGFATFGALGGTASAQLRPYEPQYEANSGVVTKSLMNEHFRRELHDANLAAGVRQPDYSHLPSEDRAAIFAPEHSEPTAATATGSGFDTGDWMRGIALAAVLIAASALGLAMVRGGARTAHS